MGQGGMKVGVGMGEIGGSKGRGMSRWGGEGIIGWGGGDPTKGEQTLRRNWRVTQLVYLYILARENFGGLLCVYLHRWGGNP